MFILVSELIALNLNLFLLVKIILAFILVGLTVDQKLCSRPITIQRYLKYLQYGITAPN